jgi:hypothetical protein
MFRLLYVAFPPNNDDSKSANSWPDADVGYTKRAHEQHLVCSRVLPPPSGKNTPHAAATSRSGKTRWASTLTPDKLGFTLSPGWLFVVGKQSCGLLAR